MYVDTNAVPEGFVNIDVPGVEWLATDPQPEIINALAERPTATVRELADAADCSKEHVRDTFDRPADRDPVDRRDTAGEHGADIHTDASANGSLLDLAETTNDP